MSSRPGDTLVTDAQHTPPDADAQLVWTLRDQRVEHDHGIFRLRSHLGRHPTLDVERRFVVLDGADWVNVIAVTSDARVVMVRQFRHGTESVTLEIPGGLIEPGEDPLDAGVRELREESGWAAERWVHIGAVHPNPAIQNNACHTILGVNARRVGDATPDDGEALRTVMVDLADVPQLIVRGEITHSLVVAAFFLFRERVGGWVVPG